MTPPVYPWQDPQDPEARAQLVHDLYRLAVADGAMPRLLIRVRDERIVAANPAFANALSTTLEVFEGRTIIEAPIFPNPEAFRETVLHSEVRRNGFRAGTTLVGTTNATMYPHRVVAKPVTLAGEDFVLAELRVVTMLRTLQVAGIKDLVAFSVHSPFKTTLDLKNPESLVLNHNIPRLGRYLGYSDYALIGVSYEEFTHPEDWVEESNQLIAMGHGEIDQYRIIKRIRAVSGTWRWFDFFAKGYANPDGTIGFIELLGRDVHVRHDKGIEQERALASALDASTNKAELAARAAEDRRRLLALVSHELRTPLNAILGFPKLIRAEKCTETQESFLKQIERSGSELLRVVENMVSFVEADGHVDDNLSVTYQPTALIGEITRHQQARAAAKGLTIQQDANFSSDATLEGHPSFIRRILEALVENAIEHTRTGTVSLEVSLSANRSRVVFRVRDTGPGIDPKIQETLFEPMYPGDNSSTRTEGGLGMGLATAHQLASYLGGALELRDTSNKGSTFELSLPLLAPMDANAEGVSLDDTPDSQLGFAFPLRILVCDPDDGHNHIIAHHLRSLGYSATFTASYNASFGELARQQFDLGLFDVGHRVVVHGLREIFRKDRPDPPAFTAAMVNESVATAQSSTKDFDLRLGKPLRESDLVTLIRTALRSKFFAETDSR